MNSNLQLKGSYVIRTWDKTTGKLLHETQPISNLIVSNTGRGLDILTRQLGGDTTYAIEIDSAKIGTGSTTPVAADTDLETAVLSGIVVADVSYPAAGQVLFSFFIPDNDLANGTYTEFGVFSNSRLFARSIISPSFTKGSNQNVTVDYTITATAS